MERTDQDVVVVGAGPAGMSAAIRLATANYRVALVDRVGYPRAAAQVVWLGAKAVSVLREMNAATPEVLEGELRDVRFFSSDFAKSATPAFRDPPGIVVHRTELEHALTESARKSGVSFHFGRTVRELDPKERSVALKLDNGDGLEGRMLVLATGWGCPLVKRLGIGPDPRHVPTWCARVDAPLPRSESQTSVVVVLGIDRRGSFARICRTRSHVSIAVYLVAERDPVVAELGRICRRAFEVDLVPVDLSGIAGGAEVFSSPGAAGLEMETHVGKNSLVIGSAGGMMSAAGHEGIYPAMWSARIACETASAALAAGGRGQPMQDRLKDFDAQWRMQMADYLRAPHTDLQFLLPLIFSNQSMADRMGAAFFTGVNL